MDVLAKFRPEVAAGGFPRDDGTVAFYTRVRSLLSGGQVLNFGAGRGEMAADPVTYRRDLMDLRDCATVVAADIDPVVADNPLCHEAHVLADGTLPFRDGHFDMVVADWVLEHLADPGATFKELTRVLKPGGWFCARTPNAWGYVAIGSRLVPKALHDAVLARLMPERSSADIFETHYRANTIGQVARLLPDFDHYGYTDSERPKYHANNAWLWRLIGAYNTLAPSFLKPTLYVFARKR